MMGSYIVLILFAFLVDGVFGATDEVKSVMKGDSVTLNSTSTKKEHETMQWYFKNIRIALINGDPSKNCLYDGPGGIFKDRLKVNFKTGSLTIMNIRSEHAGRYEVEIIRSDSQGTSRRMDRNGMCNKAKITSKSSDSNSITNTFNLTVSASDSDQNKKDPQKALLDQETDTTVPDSGLSPAVVAGIGVGVVLLVAAAVAVICRRRRSSRKDMEKNKEGLL